MSERPGPAKEGPSDSTSAADGAGPPPGDLDVEVTTGSETRLVPLSGEVTRVGRSKSNEIRIPDPRVSGLHCSITRLPDGKFVVNDSSTNGTWVNGTRLGPGSSAPLGAGDAIGIAGLRPGFPSLKLVPRASAAAGAVKPPRLTLDSGGEADRAVTASAGAVKPPRLTLDSGGEADRAVAASLLEATALVRRITATLSCTVDQCVAPLAQRQAFATGVYMTAPGAASGAAASGDVDSAGSAYAVGLARESVVAAARSLGQDLSGLETALASLSRPAGAEAAAVDADAKADGSKP